MNHWFSHNQLYSFAIHVSCGYKYKMGSQNEILNSVNDAKIKIILARLALEQGTQHKRDTQCIIPFSCN